MEDAAKALGGLDVLINNAGSLIKRTPFEELADDLIDKVFDLNVRSVIAACQAAVPYMEKAGRGSIVNVGSIAGDERRRARRFGLRRFQGLHPQSDQASCRASLPAKNIRVNAVAPGVIETPFHAATSPDRMEAMRQSIPIGRARRRRGLRRRLPLPRLRQDERLRHRPDDPCERRPADDVNAAGIGSWKARPVEDPWGHME